MRLIALLRLVVELSPLPKGSDQGKGDRLNLTPFCRLCFLLIFSALQILFLPNFANAQKTNELCFEESITKFLVSDPREFSGVRGFQTDGLAGKLDSVPDAPYQLRIGVPQVNYENLQGPYFAREITTDLTFVDSTDHLSTVTWRDTLHKRDIAASRKGSPPELKGTDPRWTAKILWPAAMITGGIAGIISLFYIRSA